MKVLDKRRNNVVPINTLSYGTVFTDTDNEIMMVIESEELETQYIKAVNLETGGVFRFVPTYSVYPIHNAKIVLED